MQLFCWFVSLVVCHFHTTCKSVAPLTEALARQNGFFAVQIVERGLKQVLTLPCLVSGMQTLFQGLSFLKVLKFRLFRWSFESMVWVRRLKIFLQALSRCQTAWIQDSRRVNCFHHESGHSAFQVSLQGLWIGFVEYRISLRCRRVWNFRIRKDDQEVRRQEFIQWSSLLLSLLFLQELLSKLREFFGSWKQQGMKSLTSAQENCMLEQPSWLFRRFDLCMWESRSWGKIMHKEGRKSKFVQRLHFRDYQEACSI